MYTEHVWAYDAHETARKNHNATKFYRKIGGLHFFRFWRIRVSFCLTKATTTKESNYGRTGLYDRYLVGQ